MRRLKNLNEIHEAIDAARLAHPSAKIPQLSEREYTRIFALIDFLLSAPLVEDRKQPPRPVEDALILLRKRVEEATEHWEASSLLIDQEEIEFRLQRLSALHHELDFFLRSIDWLLEPRIVINQTGSHYLSEKLAHIVAFEWRSAGAGEISPGTNSPLVKAVRALRNLLEVPDTVDAISQVLRKKKPRLGWGSEKPFRVPGV